MSARISVLAVATLALALAAPVHADDADKDKPINFSSDTGGYSRASNTGDLCGNAVITQGTLTLHADCIKFKVNADNSVSATATGNPVSFRQRREGTDEYDEAYAQRIAYDGQKQLVELFDRALLKRGSTNEMRSDYISYNRSTDYASVGTPPSAATPTRPVSRVTGVILPKDVNAADQGKSGKEAPVAPKAGDNGAKAGDANAKPGDNGKVATPAPASAPKPAADATAPLTIDTDMKSK
jgi:lipopolysaccharide export system protein LptA